MDKLTLYFTANKQTLAIAEKPKIAIGTVNYVEAIFDLDDTWKSFDAVRAIWATRKDVISVGLINDICIVPSSLLSKQGVLYVNLVGSSIDGDVLTERLTTKQIPALSMRDFANFDAGSEEEIEPSQFERFVAEVKADAESCDKAANSTKKDAAYCEAAVKAIGQVKSYSFEIVNGDLILYEEEVALNGGHE